MQARAPVLRLDLLGDPGIASGAPGTPATVDGEALGFSANGYSRSIAENSTDGSNVGDAITATDSDDATLTYSLPGTGASNFSVNSTGPITVASGASYGPRFQTTKKN